MAQESKPKVDLEAEESSGSVRVGSEYCLWREGHWRGNNPEAEMIVGPPEGAFPRAGIEYLVDEQDGFTSGRVTLEHRMAQE